ncbi:MAG TPA: hydrogenase maturation nickel metallochaperone HypA [Gammaproteobacteria bacterium]|nr:hydrogenase nickel incorporation protein HybF [bacterium BMS3Abin11]HDH14876.1 hydrogenase maturation nickel metallochaperone HypA [Gammaproteobacteria bacterium]HDZ79185.1 hydrogenase maturation nickel metallochaperone HypA [Gammaproteobacteria bacterium]
MHELSICQSMLKQVNALARKHSASQVQSIHLQIGPLSGIEAELLMQSFPLVSAGTIAEGAELHIEKLPVRIRCQLCNKDSNVSVNQLICPHCGDSATQLLSGDEMFLHSIKLDG